ncbi:bestrophin family protein [Bacillus cereus]|uniref:bestrophin family protein n=1 Tax=Bacillus cereus TaxID=1396 RepID=UPI000BF90E9B|nr:bestrophin family ion channel [Bacillus cereus]PFI78871.1 hypothetical protein COI83_26400 [Bacillus cereus]
MIYYSNQESFKQIFTLKGTVVREIFKQVILYSCVSICIVLIHNYWGIHINPTPWVIVGGALGLLLVFRTNTAYDRYWEGRKLFGGIGSSSRNLAVSFLCYWDSKESTMDNEKLKFLHLLIAFPKLAKQHLRNEKELSEVTDLLELCSNKEKEMLMKSNYLPLTIIFMLKNVIKKGLKSEQLPPNTLINMEDELDNLLNSIGGCDRIKSTPIPFAYFAHIKSILIIFCGTLSIGLVDSMGWITVIATMFISFAFLGIEAIGVEIEDPFGQDLNDLPLEEICIGVEKHLLNLYDQSDLLELPVSNSNTKVI